MDMLECLVYIVILFWTMLTGLHTHEASPGSEDGAVAESRQKVTEKEYDICMFEGNFSIQLLQKPALSGHSTDCILGHGALSLVDGGRLAHAIPIIAVFPDPLLVVLDVWFVRRHGPLSTQNQCNIG